MGNSDLVQCHCALLGVMCGEACEEETALYSLMVEGRKDSQQCFLEQSAGTSRRLKVLQDSGLWRGYEEFFIMNFNFVIILFSTTSSHESGAKQLTFLTVCSEGNKVQIHVSSFADQFTCCHNRQNPNQLLIVMHHMLFIQNFLRHKQNKGYICMDLMIDHLSARIPSPAT